MTDSSASPSNAAVKHHRDMDAEVEVDDEEDEEFDRHYIEGVTPLRFRFSWRKLWRFVRPGRLEREPHLCPWVCLL